MSWQATEKSINYVKYFYKTCFLETSLIFLVENMKQKEALLLLKQSANMYKENLLNKNLLFVFLDKDKFEGVEILFTNTYFKHLTGIQTQIGAKDFFDQIINDRFNIKNIVFRKDGTTELKLKILPNLMDISVSYKMIGYYNENNLTQIFLETQSVLGNINTCLGIRKDLKSGYYYPNTSLKRDIRQITNKQYPIICIFRKGKKDDKYNELCYLSKKHKDFKEDVLKVFADKLDLH